MTVAICAVATAFAVGCVAAPPADPLQRLRDGTRMTGTGAHRRRPALILAAVGGAAAAVVTALGRPSLAVAAAIAAVVVVRRVVRGRAERTAEATRHAVPEFAAALAGELRAGHNAVAALSAASLTAPVCLRPHLAASVATADLGGDVAAALRVAARTPGAAALDRLAACWAVTVGLGAAPGPAVARLADGERARARHRAAVTAELAGVRATAGLLVALPVVGLALGAGLGAHPLVFLTGTPAGSACLTVGVALQAAGLAWTDRMAVRALAAGGR